MYFVKPCTKIFQLLMILACSSAFSLDSSAGNKAVFLTSERSGTNLVSLLLTAITRKPTGVFPNITFPLGTNLFDVEPVSDVPFLYRIHEPGGISVGTNGTWGNYNRFILLSRNPKELLCRTFSITQKSDLHRRDVESFIKYYLSRFRKLESWAADKRLCVFYEDVISELDDTLLNILEFLGEEPRFMDDYIEHKAEYIDAVFNNYRDRYHTVKGGVSSLEGAKVTFYTQDKDVELLEYMDQVIEAHDPLIWKKYLKRFKTDPM
jgi:hypothetical protein